MKVIKAPNKLIFDEPKSIFLAGSIEMGKAENWQERVTKELKKFDNVVIFNPRRDDWDSTWEQKIDNQKLGRL